METIEVFFGNESFTAYKKRFLEEKVFEFLEHVPENLLDNIPPEYKVINPIEEPEIQIKNDKILMEI